MLGGHIERHNQYICSALHSDPSALDRPTAAHLVSTPAHVLRQLRQLRQPSKILLSIAPPRCQSRNAERTVSHRDCRISFGRSTRNAACCAVVGICKDPICQVGQTPPASGSKTRNAASLCYIQTYRTGFVHESAQANMIYSCVAVSNMSRHSIVSLFPASIAAAGLT